MANIFTNILKDLGDGEQAQYIKDKIAITLTGQIDPNADSFSSDVVLFLQFNESPAIDDKGHTVTLTGTASIDTTIKYDGAGAFASNGTGGNVTVANHADFNLSGDFTVEAMVRFTSMGDMMLACRISGTDANQQIRINTGGTSGALSIYNSTNGSISTSEFASFTVDTWHHIAFCRSSNTMRFYCDGNKLGTDKTMTSGINLSGADFYINGGYSYTNCRIDNYRITKAARYTGATYDIPW